MDFSAARHVRQLLFGEQTRLDAHRELDLFGRVQQRNLADLLQVVLDRVGRGAGDHRRVDRDVVLVVGRDDDRAGRERLGEGGLGRPPRPRRPRSASVVSASGSAATAAFALPRVASAARRRRCRRSRRRRPRARRRRRARRRPRDPRCRPRSPWPRAPCVGFVAAFAGRLGCGGLGRGRLRPRSSSRRSPWRPSSRRASAVVADSSPRRCRPAVSFALVARVWWSSCLRSRFAFHRRTRVARPPVDFGH